MPKRQLRFTAPDALVKQGLAEIRAQFEIPESFPTEVLDEARALEPTSTGEDRTDIPFVTIDPPGSRDLDQALHLEAAASGYRVRYAIADVAAFVRPGGALDREARERGLTKYGPDRPTPLYPSSLSENLASLLPDEDRPSLLWTLDLDDRGALTDVGLQRAVIRSRAQLDYQTVQDELGSGSAPDSLQLLAEVGRLRQLMEQDRGAISLPIPDQVAVRNDGGWELEYRTPLPVEGWNAQISLLTGIAAARLMVDAGTGILRTLPPARPDELQWIRRVAKALDISWPEDVDYAEMIRSLDARIPAQAALLAESTTLFAGAGYQVLQPGTDPHEHSALATTYAHVTAPLRRLVDRFAGETCLAISQDREIPEWVADGLPAMPETMARADSMAGSYEAACLNLVEAAVLSDRVGQVFDGVVVEVDQEDPHGDVQVRNPAVHARIEDADLELGEEIEVRLVEASVANRRVVFERA